MGISKRDRWDEIAKKLGSEFKETVALHNKYEDLREKLTQAGGAEAIEKSPVAAEVSFSMKLMEEEFYVIWEPHQETVGACPSCGGVRMPGATPEGFGFGCLKCQNFEVFGTDSGDPLLN